MLTAALLFPADDDVRSTYSRILVHCRQHFFLPATTTSRVEVDDDRFVILSICYMRKHGGAMPIKPS